MTPDELDANAARVQADRADLARVWQDGYNAGWLDGDESPRTEAPNPYTLGGAHLDGGDDQ